MKVRERLRARLLLLRLSLRGTVEEREAATIIRKNDEMFEEFTLMLFSQVDAQGALTDFLDWILENREAILELILTIISLFGDNVKVATNG